MINEEINLAPAKTVRVIGPENEQLGLMNLSAARNMAYDKGLDLVLIAPQAEAPVCRIMDYCKFRVERDKKDRLVARILPTDERPMLRELDKANCFITYGRGVQRWKAGDIHPVELRWPYTIPPTR